MTSTILNLIIAICGTEASYEMPTRDCIASVAYTNPKSPQEAIKRKRLVDKCWQKSSAFHDYHNMGEFNKCAGT